MIKKGTRRALRTNGTVLLVNHALFDYDDSGNVVSRLVGGDLVMLNGKRFGDCLFGVVVATGEPMWLRRSWLIEHATVAFDARSVDA